MNRKLRKILVFSALSTLAMLPSGASGQARQDEEFRYNWQLRNFIGTLAALFLPHQGEGSLTFRTDANGRLRSELTITSNAAQGEFFRYGSELDIRTQQPIRAWSAYSWRGETKSKNDPIEQNGVLDVASGIYTIRQNPPEKPRRMEIWSDGKIYPVVVMPLGPETRKTSDGRAHEVRHYSIRGVDSPGRRRWKGKLDLWLARDEAATPVEILISRNLADVRMELKKPY
jgi:uncharacterized protein DUF3108